jgi:EXLDI family protein
MPNRTIYVADADLPIFEKAQELTEENLSATITQALRHFVEAEEARASGFEEVTVKVGKIAHSYKRFRGRLLAKEHVRDQSQTRRTVYEIYQTARGKLAVYIRNAPNWETSKTWSYRNLLHYDWSQWPGTEYEFCLEVYESFEELRGNVPQELYEAVAQALKGDPDGVEFLDI